MAQEITFTFDWGAWIPIIIAGLSLSLSFLQMKRQSSRDSITQLESKVDRAATALKECEDNLKHFKRENDALRREKFVLLEQISRLTRPADLISDKTIDGTE